MMYIIHNVLVSLKDNILKQFLSSLIDVYLTEKFD